MKNNFKFFENKECQYYPCHKMKEINCLFCYCPLYLIDCGGNYKILENDIKDCSNCFIPHHRENYDFILNQFKKKSRK